MVHKKNRRLWRGRAVQKQKRKDIASSHISSLLGLAKANYMRDRELAEKQATLAWQIATRHNVRLGRERIYFCRGCKKFILPPDGARYRLSKKRCGMNITCLSCGKTYRKLHYKV